MLPFRPLEFKKPTSTYQDDSLQAREGRGRLGLGFLLMGCVNENVQVLWRSMCIFVFTVADGYLVS